MRGPLALLALLLAASPAAGSAAHPEDHPEHRYAGAWTGAGASPPACVDPAAPTDHDPEVGAGGACFPFATAWGDDTGAIVRVWVEEDAPSGDVLFVACEDHDGDGACSSAAGEQVVPCHTGPTGRGGYWLGHDPSPCALYAHSSAVDKTIYVALLPADPRWGNAEPVSGVVRLL